MKSIPIIGQTLYSLNVGNMARNREQELTPVIVRSVGRKYFTTSTEEAPHHEKNYHLENWREKTEYSANSELYESRQEWENKKERDILWKGLRVIFDVYTPNAYSLETLREVKKLLDASK